MFNIKKLTAFFLLIILLFCTSTAVLAYEQNEFQSEDQSNGASEQIGFINDKNPQLISEEPFDITDDMSFIRVLITVGNVNTVSLKICGSYYIQENMYSMTGSSDYPKILTISSSNNIITIQDDNNILYTGETATIQRADLTSSAGYAQLITEGDENNNGRKYLGNFCFKADANDCIRMINIVPTAHYLYGIVPYEMSESWNIEALKSQAIAAKCYALAFPSDGEDFDITDSYNYQGYRGYQEGYNKCMQACIEVCGKALAIDNQIVLTFYGATNGGETALPSQSFSSSVLDFAYDVAIDNYDFEYATNRRETIEIIYGEVPLNANFNTLLQEEIMNQYGESSTIISILEASLHSPKYDICQRNMTKMDVRMIIEKNDGCQDVITITFDVAKLKANGVFNKPHKIYWGEPTEVGYNVYFVRYGHGIGLSQCGAQARALNGKTYEEILAFYYSKMKLINIKENNPEDSTVEPQETLAYGVINVPSARMRSGPGTNYEHICSLSLNTPVDVLGECDGWLVCSANNMVGYIRGDLVDITGFPTSESGIFTIGFATIPAGVRVYRGPSSYSAVVNTTNTNLQGYVWHEVGDWYHIRTGAVEGFVKKNEITVLNWVEVNPNGNQTSKIHKITFNP